MTVVIVSGAIANKHLNGGEAWVRLSWVLGLRRLGFDVYFVEQIAREACVSSSGAASEFETSANVAYFDAVVEEFGLAGSAALVYESGQQTRGLAFPELIELARSAALLVNISGHLEIEALMCRLRRKAYIDLDPGFTQFWHAAGNTGARLAGHDYYFTVGESIGTEACSIPTCGLPWQPIRPPVVLEQWPVERGGNLARFTTIATWRGPYGPVEHAGKSFGLKVHEFRKFIELPTRAPATFEIALDIHPGDAGDLEKLRQDGWRIVDPAAVASSPDAFRTYVQGSGAEFSVAQGIYVDTQSGWFSDRTVRYLASGKPALVQDTGFSRNYPVGKGLVAFRTLEEAATGVERLVSEYETHSRYARELAERYFDSDKVLAHFVSRVGISP